MSHMPTLKHNDMVDILTHDGWKCVGQTGSHEQFKHDSKPNVVTVTNHGPKDIPCGTVRSILKTAGLDNVLKQLQHGASIKQLSKQMAKEMRAHLA